MPVKKRATDYLPPKHALYSKTVWINILTVAVACASFVGTDPLFAEHSKYILLFVGISNIVLRFLTDEGVGITGPVQRSKRLAYGHREAHIKPEVLLPEDEE